MGLSVTHFSRDPETGRLTPEETFPTVPEGAPREGASVAEIFLHPSARWLYVSNRKRDTYAVFAVRPDGTLAWAEEPSAHVKVPRGFAIDPTGKWLVSAGQDDDRVTVLAIDPQTGMLTPTGNTIEVGNPVCVIFAP
jgi:6-phosphogluconolactonase